MAYGYSQNLVQANKKASAGSLGVALGRICIRRGISVIQLAERFGVSRMTIYNWFKGANTPHADVADQIQRYIKSLR